MIRRYGDRQAAEWKECRVLSPDTDVPVPAQLLAGPGAMRSGTQFLLPPNEEGGLKVMVVVAAVTTISSYDYHHMLCTRHDNKDFTKTISVRPCWYFV